MIDVIPAIEAHFHKVLEDHTAGDPMRLEVKWTNLSRRQIAGRMKDLGTAVSRDVVSQLQGARISQAEGVEEGDDGAAASGP